jgi:hypothetical protein
LPLGQKAKQIERARPDGDRRGDTRLIEPAQSSTAAIEAEALEEENFDGTEPVLRSLSGNF